MGSHALKEVRQSISTLRVDPLVGLSLQEAIANLVEEFKRSSGISTILRTDLQQPIKNEIKIAVYRIIQEALTNIYKHASATEVTIDIHTETHLMLRIRDNGKGFQLEENTTGFGLQSMRDRTLAVGGNLKIETVANGGCKIIASFPLN